MGQIYCRHKRNPLGGILDVVVVGEVGVEVVSHRGLQGTEGDHLVQGRVRKGMLQGGSDGDETFAFCLQVLVCTVVVV